MLNQQQYLIACIAEEGAEVAQAAMKCMRFGLNDSDPRDQMADTNTNRLITEYGQLVCLMNRYREGLSEEDAADFDWYLRRAIANKNQAYIDYLDVSIRLGVTEP